MTELADQYARYDRLTSKLPAPVGLLDMDALEHNATDMLRRAAGTTIRLATKSLRCRELIQFLAAKPGITGVLASTLAEALWLRDHGVTDIVVGYPTADRDALAQLGRSAGTAAPVVLMVDSLEHVDFLIEHVAPSAQHPLQVCLDLDAGLRIGRSRLGALRSPVHSIPALRTLAEAIAARPAVRIVGLMAYEAQIAGVYDDRAGPRGLAIRTMQSVSRREIARRRRRAAQALRDIAELRFVNGGGTGSLESTAREESVTEIAAGSGFLAPGLFDRYRAFGPRPAAHFALDVVRRPGPGIVTALGGGWVASGPPGADRLPTIAYPPRLRLTGREAAGETQTPLVGADADQLQIGDRVWFRHAKSGELSEHLNEMHLVRGDELVGSWQTYRGAGKVFL